MEYEVSLSKATQSAERLTALLVAMTLACEDMESADTKSLIELALELSESPACWLMEELSIREKKDA
ncbi:hypothetical protein SME10J_36570 [Serratia marcescens]|nr:hypothetical protein SME10J_36570 [Serratia marcescens]